jgi:hypothetical protein
VRREVGNGFVYNSRWDHEPERARLFQLAHEVRGRGRADRPFPRQIRDRLWRHIEDHALMAAFDKSPDHIGTHPAEANHRKLHDILPG